MSLNATSGVLALVEASALIDTEKSFHRGMGDEQLWMLRSYLGNPAEIEEVA